MIAFGWSPRTVRGSGIRCEFLVPAVTRCPGLPWFYCTVGSRYRPSRQSRGRNFSREARVSLSVPRGTVSRADEKGRCCACRRGCGVSPWGSPRASAQARSGDSACGLRSRGLTFRVAVPRACALPYLGCSVSSPVKRSSRLVPVA